MHNSQTQSFTQAFNAITDNRFSAAFQIIAKKPCAEHLQLGQWLMHNQQPLVAAHWYQYLISENFAEPQLNYWCGVYYSAAGEFQQAEHYLNNAINSRNDSENDLELPYIALAQMLQKQNNIAQAHTTLQQMLKRFPNNLKLRTQSGALFVESQEYAIAIEYFKQATKLFPNEAMIYNDLASCYQHLGEFEKSHKMYTKALTIDPQISGAYLGLATSKKYSEQDNSVIDFLDSAHQQTNNEEVDACFHFAKAKIYDDMQHFTKAWDNALCANEICRQHQTPFSHSGWASNIDNIIKHYPKLVKTSKSLHTTPIPVFVIGMPRSGTTLLEKLLSGFEGLSIAGELDGFDHILGSIAGNNAGIYYPAQIAAISSQQKQQLRDFYLQMLTAKSDSKSRWIVDKNPLNFIHLGLIQWLFPEAIFIHNKRQPMDILLSNFFQFFAHPNLSYSFGIDDIISFIRGYHRLMAHWLGLSTTTGVKLLEIEYSDVVQHTEDSLETLKQFLGSDNYQQPSGQEIITTASIWQARQPIYSSSIERWKNYQLPLEGYSKDIKKWL